jgi:hypothetical protein
MPKTDDRSELERRLAQARLTAKEPADSATTERLQKLVLDLEQQLR